jgi:hypothetical protein
VGCLAVQSVQRYGIVAEPDHVEGSPWPSRAFRFLLATDLLVVWVPTTAEKVECVNSLSSASDDPGK